MVERCIMIFPELSNMNIIDEIRAKYDPLAHHVRPHITLVFPFQSEISASELMAHLKGVLSQIEPFKIILHGITPVQSFGNYLFLEITEGIEEIVDIHKRLYTGLLESFHPQWLKAGGYYPHMTVGKLESVEEYRNAIEDVKDINDIFSGVVNKVSVEIIDENEDSLIDLEVWLD
jgi:2'-5' RNA ligase